MKNPGEIRSEKFAVTFCKIFTKYIDCLLKSIYNHNMHTNKAGFRCSEVYPQNTGSGEADLKISKGGALS